jgi:hypothetical protein
MAGLDKQAAWNCALPLKDPKKPIGNFDAFCRFADEKIAPYLYACTEIQDECLNIKAEGSNSLHAVARTAYFSNRCN